MSTNRRITEPCLQAPCCRSRGFCIRSVMVSACLLLLKLHPAWIVWLFLSGNPFISLPVSPDRLSASPLVFCALSQSIPLRLHNLCSLFFPPLPFAQVSLSPRGKLVCLLPFPGVTPGAHVAFPLLDPLVSSSAGTSSAAVHASRRVGAFVCNSDRFTNPVPKSYSRKAAWPLASRQAAVPCNRTSRWGHVSCRCLLLPPPNYSFVSANHVLLLAANDAGVLASPCLKNHGQWKRRLQVSQL